MMMARSRWWPWPWHVRRRTTCLAIVLLMLVVLRILLVVLVTTTTTTMASGELRVRRPGHSVAVLPSTFHAGHLRPVVSTAIRTVLAVRERRFGMVLPLTFRVSSLLLLLLLLLLLMVLCRRRPSMWSHLRGRKKHHTKPSLSPE